LFRLNNARVAKKSYKTENLIAGCGDSFDLRIDAVDAPLSVHLRVRDKSTSDKVDPHFCHR
jgi:hypothetical protein